jgi:polyhydroxyalkanoate synthase subunit PhaC
VFFPLKFLLKYVPVAPLEFFAAMVAPLLGRIRNRAEEFLGWPENLSSSLSRKFHAHGLHQVSPAILLEQAELFAEGGIKNQQGQPMSEGLTNVQIPVLTLTGVRDRQVNAKASQRAHELLGSAKKEFVTFGKDFGQEQHYGHLDLVIGRNVKVEVYPKIESWLELF